MSLFLMCESQVQALILMLSLLLFSLLLFQFPVAGWFCSETAAAILLMLLLCDGCKQTYPECVEQPLSKSGYLLYYSIHTG